MINLRLCWGWLLWLAFVSALAEPVLDLARIEQERKTIETSALADKEKQRAIEWLDRARQWLQQAEAAEEARRRLDTRVKQAPDRLKRIERLLQQPERLTRTWPPLKLSRPLEALELQLAAEESALDKAQEALAQQEQQLAELLEAATVGGQRIAELEQELTEVERVLETAPTNPMERARHLALQAKRRWLQAELERLRLQQTHLALLTKLARGERDLSGLETAEHRRRVERLRQAVQLLREHQVVSASHATELALRTSEPQVRPLLERNLAWWSELEHLIAESKQLRQRAETLEQRIETLERDFERIRQAIELAGTDATLAELLYHRLQTLPGVSQFRREAERRRTRLKQAVVRRFEIEEILRQLGDLDRQLEAHLARLPKDMPPGKRALIRLQLREALQNHREALQALQQEYTRYLTILSELDALERQLYEKVQTYRRFLQRQLLWIPYRKGPTDLNTLLQPLATVFSPAHLADLSRRLQHHFQQSPWFPVLTIVITLALLGLRRWARDDLRRLGPATRSIRTDRYLNTLRALGDTIILAAPLPLLLFGFGVWLRRHALADPALEPLAQGLILAGRPAAVLGMLDQLCLPEGLAQRHLRWLQITCDRLRHHLHWFHPWAVVGGFVIGVTDSPSLTPLSLGLGRLTFVLLMASSAILIWRLWRRDSAILTQLAASRPGWAVRYHALWFPLALAVPLGLALAAMAGYYYAAFYLAERAFRTLWFFLVLMLVKDFLLRWLYVTERRLRYAEILRRREELRAQKPETSSELPPVEEPEVDFGRLSEQTRRLFRIGFFSAAVVGMWLIWQEAAPILNVLEQITLPMTTTRTVGGVTKETPLTLADVTTGVLVGVLTMLAAHNLPGLLEFAIFRHLPLTQGTRYAWSALTQYLIAAIGIYLIFRALGVQWSEIQWLVAALSVGVGFGLQEVVANFISGIILLFERPIRVGDVVTVGEVTGTVSRIRIRATTILNWDRQELVIPNKNFITNEFINWTLTDTTNRIVIQIGVAYGCDIDKAMGIVMETARSHPEVLDDPAPLVTFENFGDNALLVILRAYLGTLDNRLSTITDLHRQIYQRLGEAGIEIAFPQRDVHLDTRAPLEVVVRQSADTTSS